MFKPVINWGNSSNVFISNGSRLYLDVGSHPEYATAETTRVDELIASDAAGDAIMHHLVKKLNKPWQPTALMVISIYTAIMLIR